MAHSRTGLWWNIVRNLGYYLVLRNFGTVGSNPESVSEAILATSPDSQSIKAVVDESVHGRLANRAWDLGVTRG